MSWWWSDELRTVSCLVNRLFAGGTGRAVIGLAICLLLATVVILLVLLAWYSQEPLSPACMLPPCYY